MIAATAIRIEAALVEALELRPVALRPEHAERTGSWRAGDAVIRSRAWTGDRVRYARFVHLSGPELEICNLLCLPACDWDAPMLGIDLVSVRAGHPVVVADLLPSLPAAGARSKVPLWAEQFFSPGVLLARPGAALAAALAEAEIRARTFRDQLRDARQDSARARARARWQDAYCHAHRRDDRTLGLLDRIFGHDWAGSYLDEVLFPVAADDAADLALARLRAATRTAHTQVESRVTLMRDDVSEHDYRRFLRATAACALPIEAQVAALAPPGAPFGCATTVRAGWLRDDLRALAEDVPRPFEVPAFASWPEAVGAAYVLEGATLGGQILLRHLSHRLPVAAAAAGRYLGSYGDDTPHRWRASRRYVGTLMAGSGAIERQVAAGALATFAAFDRAYD